MEFTQHTVQHNIYYDIYTHVILQKSRSIHFWPSPAPRFGPSSKSSEARHAVQCCKGVEKASKSMPNKTSLTVFDRRALGNLKNPLYQCIVEANFNSFCFLYSSEIADCARASQVGRWAPLGTTGPWKQLHPLKELRPFGAMILVPSSKLNWTFRCFLKFHVNLSTCT